MNKSGGVLIISAFISLTARLSILLSCRASTAHARSLEESTKVRNILRSLPRTVAPLLIPDNLHSALPLPFPSNHYCQFVAGWRWTRAHSDRPGESLVCSSEAFPGERCPHEARDEAKCLHWSVFLQDRVAEEIAPCSALLRRGNQAPRKSHARSSQRAACDPSRWMGSCK